MTYQDLKSVCAKNNVEMIDLKFCDMPGAWQHFSLPLDQLSERLFKEGSGFDGSSIRGFKKIHESDMVLIPDIDTFFIDPFSKIKTASFICNVYEAGAKTRFEEDPRYIAQKAEKYLAESGFADKSYFGPEAEFFIFDSAKFRQEQNCAFYELRSAEASWRGNGDDDPNHCGNGYKIRNKEGYFPVSPLDQSGDIRKEMVVELKNMGIEVEKEHHEVATGGQAEIDIKYSTLLKTADNLMAFKYAVKNVAFRFGRTATFMPKPLFGDNGSGMHIHISLWKDLTPLFYDQNGYAGLSATALYFIGGLLKHAPALMALCAPTTNSYKRLVPGYEAPVNLVYSASNRSAAIRIPAYSNAPESKRVEFRPSDPSANPYLAFSALLMAGINGIKNKIDPGKPTDINMYAANPDHKIPQVPDSLKGSLEALENNHQFLLEGSVFSKNFVESWIEHKVSSEYDYVKMRPSPAEFILYYDV
jgi:glutamine synthetase